MERKNQAQSVSSSPVMEMGDWWPLPLGSENLKPSKPERTGRTRRLWQQQVCEGRDTRNWGSTTFPRGRGEEGLSIDTFSQCASYLGSEQQTAEDDCYCLSDLYALPATQKQQARKPLFFTLRTARWMAMITIQWVVKYLLIGQIDVCAFFWLLGKLRKADMAILRTIVAHVRYRSVSKWTPGLWWTVAVSAQWAGKHHMCMLGAVSQWVTAMDKGVFY